MAMGKDAFFQLMDKQGIGLTYADVQTVAIAQDGVTPDVISLRTRFSRNVELMAPIVSAAMDTVTESEMAIALAKQGGIGVIHYGLSAEDQRRELRRVKLALNGLVLDPVAFKESDTLEAIEVSRSEKGYDFTTFPIIDDKGRFKGMLTSKDVAFGKSTDTAAKAMTPLAEIVHASPETTLKQAYKMMVSAKKNTLPLLNKDGTVAGLYVYSDVHRVATGNQEHYNLDINGRLRVAAAIPTDPGGIERVRGMMESKAGIPYVDVVVLDSAQGDSMFAVQTLKALKKEFPKLDVVVGNVSEPESALKLAKAGADGIKVGQGPGSICTTRIETGIGAPQLTAVYQCAKAVESFGIPVCADGGIVHLGDISKAIAAGGHSVMMGSMLAGTLEAPGRVITREDGSRFKSYRGMGSKAAFRDNAGSRVRYGNSSNSDPLPEGVETVIPYKGSVIPIVADALKALKKGMVYNGVKDIEAHRKKTLFRRNTNAGMVEARPHILTT